MLVGATAYVANDACTDLAIYNVAKRCVFRPRLGAGPAAPNERGESGRRDGEATPAAEAGADGGGRCRGDDAHALEEGGPSCRERPGAPTGRSSSPLHRSRVIEKGSSHDRLLAALGGGPLDAGPWYDCSVVRSFEGHVATVSMPLRGANKTSDVTVRVRARARTGAEGRAARRAR